MVSLIVFAVMTPTFAFHAIFGLVWLWNVSNFQFNVVLPFLNQMIVFLFQPFVSFRFFTVCICFSFHALHTNLATCICVYL